MSEHNQTPQQQVDEEMVDLGNNVPAPEGNTGSVAGGAGPGSTEPVDKGKARMSAKDGNRASGSGLPPPVNPGRNVTMADLDLWGRNITTAMANAVLYGNLN